MNGMKRMSKAVLTTAALAAAVAVAPEAARGQGAGEWLPGGDFPGVTSSRFRGSAAVEAMINWDPDGAGPLPSVLVVAGTFDAALGVPANNIAVWDGTSFFPLGAGIGPENPVDTNPTTKVYALAVAPNGDLIAGGKFTTAGGAPASNIARWDPVTSTWSALGLGVTAPSAGNDPIRAVAVLPNGDVIAGGQFTMAGGMPAERIARWDGTAWSTIGSGVTGGSSGDSYVLSMKVMPDGDLIVGGDFNVAGGVAAGRIARWNPSTDVWSPLGTGIIDISFHYVGALAVLANGDLIVGGKFTAAGDVLGTAHIARWDGSAWHPLDSGLGSGLGCDGVAVMPNGDIVAVGGFETASGVPDTVRVARWNPVTETWSAMQSGMNFTPKAAAMFNGELYVGGNFDQPYKTTTGMGRIGRWDGTAWQSLPNATNGRISAVARASNGDLLVGGAFTSIEGVAANRVARWNGSVWSPLGAGIDADPIELNTLVESITEMPNGDIVVGGTFSSAGGGVPGTRLIARWNGSTWSALGTGMEAPAGSLITVKALAALPNGDVVAGGDFLSASGVADTNGIARWDGTAWHPLGTGVSGVDSLVALANGDLVVGHGSSSVGGVPGTSRIARWDGSAWHALGTGVSPGAVRTLKVLSNGDIIAGGSFTSAGGSTSISRIARWNGSAWLGFGTPASSQVFSVAELLNGDIVASGPFTSIGGISVGFIARWDGTAWFAMGTGLDNSSSAMTVEPNGTLVVGGAFEHANGAVSAYMARWSPQGVCCIDDVCSVVTSASACVGGTFNPNATYCSPQPLDFLVASAPASILDTTGNGNGNGIAEPGESDVRIAIPVLNQRRGFGCDFTPGAPTVTGVAATLTSLTPTATVVSDVSTYPDMAQFATAGNTTPFVLSISPSHPCGTPVDLRLTLTPSGGAGSAELDVSIPIGIPAATVTFPRTAIGAAIPDDNPAGVDVTYTVAGFVSSVGDIKFRFDGTSGTSSAGSSLTGLGHSNVGDLVIKLTSPQGTTVTIVNRPGNPTPSTANNFRTLTLEDIASGSIQDIGSPNGPITGSYRPANPLSVFAGENPNGVWTLNVADVVANPGGGVNGGEGGFVRNATLQVTNDAVCQPPDNCAADFDGNGTVAVPDIFAFLSAWFSSHPSADIDGNGLVQVPDIFAFLSVWFAGC